MFMKDEICILVDIIIVDSMWVDFFKYFFGATQRFINFDTIQTKERSYHNWHFIDQFLSLAIEIFTQICWYVFIWLCYLEAWNGQEVFHLFLKPWVAFLHQKVSITFQKMQASSISWWNPTPFGFFSFFFKSIFRSGSLSRFSHGWEPLTSIFSPIFSPNENGWFLMWELNWEPVREPGCLVRTAQHWNKPLFCPHFHTSPCLEYMWY
jgi:hypothetical protein